MMQTELSPKNNLSKLLGFFQPMPLITSVTGIIPVRMSHLKFEGYQLHFYSHVKMKDFIVKHSILSIASLLIYLNGRRAEHRMSAGRIEGKLSGSNLPYFLFNLSFLFQLRCVCINACYLLFATYSVCLCFHMQVRKSIAGQHLFPLHPISVTSFSLPHAHPLHYHICAGTCTKELSASFFLRENAACSLVVKARHKVYS